MEMNYNEFEKYMNILNTELKSADNTRTINKNINEMNELSAKHPEFYKKWEETLGED